MAIGLTHWRNAWICLVLALALHVLDEALTGFLTLYNRVILNLRAEHPWIPLPIFTFPVWLGGLVIAIVLLLALTPLVVRDKPWMRVVSVVLAVIMIANAMGHAAASLYWGGFAPGVYSAPVLFIAAVALLITSIRAGRSSRPHF